MSSFEEILEKEGTLVYTNVGDSMMPLIKEGRDIIVIVKKPEGRLKRLDIPLYRRDTDPKGKYVLHRILWVRKNDYLITGDNRRGLEAGITDRHIIGVLKAIIRDGKEIDLSTNWKYKLYSHLWCDLFPIRHCVFWVRDLVKYLRRKYTK